MEIDNNTANNQPAVEPKKSRVGKIWVVIVLLVGLIFGVLISDLATLPEEGRPDFFRGVPYFNPEPSIRLHVVLTTIEVALLVSLVVIYLKVYSETKANFSLGLVVVLGALLLQTILSYPLILGLEGFIILPGILSTVADFLTLGAYAVFLYLSLE
ncbi:MAG: hypothetical protein OK455_01270 [Thaumarchaeota archaeon]|nr:hypothetical protein [Nitrososphaerota archaeon]